MRRDQWSLAGMLLSVSMGLSSVEAASGPIQLTDVTRATGIDFVHTDGSTGQRYIVETVSAGLATFDYDGDGWIDILFLNGTTLRGTNAAVAPTLRLYRNLGNWQFVDVTRAAGLAVSCYALGVAIGDYDQDGQPDIFVNNFGTNVLFRNRGDGTFIDATAQAGVADEPHVGAGACFLDMDGDGDLDLFVAHYVGFTFETHRGVQFNGYPAYVGPLDYPPSVNRLYRNQGDGTFQDASAAAGIAAHKGAGMGMVCADIDADGDTDIFVGNDELGNFLFLNDGHGRFQEVSLVRGLSLDFDGKAHGTMGTECGDFNNDGWLDFFVTSYQQEGVVLFRNLGKGIFEDVTRVTGAGAGTLPLVTWGCGLVDFDQDGHLDLFIAAGHLQDNVEQFDTTTTYFQRNVLLRNNGQGKFDNVTEQAGDGLAVKLSSRGAAFDDLDNDGRVDVVILNSRREPTILRNVSPKGHHWLQVRLRGRSTNREGVGAQVKLIAGDRQWLQEVHSGRSYQSHYGTRLTFGLGTAERIDRLEVRWIGGETEVFSNLGIDRQVDITEGRSKAAIQSTTQLDQPGKR
jgi:enediyne biosynthesis protein E4